MPTSKSESDCGVLPRIRFKISASSARVTCFSGLLKYDEALMLSKELDVVMIPYELAEGMEQTKQIMESVKPGQSVGIFIGPEGGFEKEEVEQAKEAGASEITLGKRILRTETAGLTALSILMYHLEK